MKLLSEIHAISRDAGTAILAVYQRDFEQMTKSDQSPLTEADLLADQIIKQGLKKLSPEIPVLSEESVAEFSGPNQQSMYWLVDPLDGTKEFINKTGEFTVNIALIRRGKPVLSVVYVPVKDILYSAEFNQGAYKVSGGESVKIQVSVRPSLEPVRLVGSRSHGTEMGHWLAQFDSYSVMTVGSSLKFCLVAEGQADIYPRFGSTSLWDTAAAQLILEEAGGKVVDLAGRCLDYSNPEVLLNPYFLALGAIDLKTLKLE